MDAADDRRDGTAGAPTPTTAWSSFVIDGPSADRSPSRSRTAIDRRRRQAGLRGHLQQRRQGPARPARRALRRRTPARQGRPALRRAPRGYLDHEDPHVRDAAVFARRLHRLAGVRRAPRDDRQRRPRRRGPRRRGRALKRAGRPERPPSIESPPAHGKTPAGRTGTGPGGQCPLLDRLRERRLLHLLRARPGRRAGARPDADRLPDHRHLLPVHGGDLRRGDRDVPRGGRLVELRPPGVQRVLVVLRRLGPDAQLRRDGRDLRVLRPALPRQRLLGGAAPLARGHHRRRADHRDPGRDQRRRGEGVRGPEHRARGRGLPHPGAAGGRRRGARARREPRPARGQRAPRRRADVEGLHPRDPDRHDRLHGDRDDLEHGRGGQGRDQDDPGGDQARGDRRVRDLLHAARGGAGRAAGPAGRQRQLLHPARPPRGAGRLRGRPDRGPGRQPQPRRGAAAGGDLRRHPRRHDPLPGHQRRPDRRLAARVLDGHPPPDAGSAQTAAPEIPHAVDRDHRLRRWSRS